MLNLEPVSETLFTPLIGRSSADQWHSSFRDPWATQLLSRFEIRKGSLNGSHVMAVIRSHLIDQWVREFIETHPKAKILSLGAGFCTRFNRIDNGKIFALDFDLQAVTEMKTRHLGIQERWSFVAGDITQNNWLENLRGESSPSVIILEGLLHYLSNDDVVLLFQRLSKSFPRAYLIFDFYSPLISKLRITHPRTSKGRVKLKWGVANLHELKKDGIEFNLIREASLVEESKKYIWRHRLLPPFSLVRNFYRLAEVVLG
jgi:O-methyltransferase involved in polyketide biosynthesis